VRFKKAMPELNEVGNNERNNQIAGILKNAVTSSPHSRDLIHVNHVISSSATN